MSCLIRLCRRFLGTKPDATCVIQNLYLSSWQASADRTWLRQHGIGGIVNLAQIDGYGNVFAVASKKDGFQVDYLSYNLDDVETNGQQMRGIFNETNEFIRAKHKQNQGVLVHCYAGISRSPSVVLASLIAEHKMSLKRAHDLLKSQRPQIRPNPGFMKALSEFEGDTLGYKTAVSPDYFAYME